MNAIRTFFVLAMCVGLSARLWAQEPTDAEPPVGAGEEDVITVLGPPDAAVPEESDDDKVTVTMANTDVRLVFTMLADMRADANVVVGNDVEGVVPMVRLIDTPWEEALRIVADSVGCEVKKESDTQYRVVKPEKEVAPEGIDLEMLRPEDVAAIPLPKVRELLHGEEITGLAEEDVRGILRGRAGQFIKRLSVQEVPAIDVVNLLAAKGNLNFAYSRTPTMPAVAAAQDPEAPTPAPMSIDLPPITMNLRYMDLLDVLRIVSEQGGLEAVYDKGVWRVAPKPPGLKPQEPLILEPFQVQYIPIDEEVLELCTKLVSKRGSIAKGKNKILVVRDVKDGVEAIRRTLEAMDIPTPQVLIEARFFELNDSFSDDLGIDWNQLGQTGWRVGTGPASLQRTNLHDRLYRFNNGSRQRTTTVTNDVTTDLGTGAISGTLTNTDVDDLTQPYAAEDFYQDQTTQSLQSTILDVEQLNVVLHALNATAKATQLSNPKVVVASDDQATIHIGAQTPILKSTITGEAGIKSYELDGDFGGQEYEAVSLLGSEAGNAASMRRYTTPKGYLDLGTKLTVAPSVKSEDRIYVKVMPELVSVTGYETTGAGDRYPQLFTTRVDTEFTVQDSQTIAIGGLVNERDRKEDSKIPVLGELPLAGRLFRYESTERVKTETIIFLTVRIAPGQELTRTSAIPVRAHLVQPEVDRIRMEDENGSMYDEERARETLRSLREAEAGESTPPQRSSLFRGRSRSDEAAHDAEPAVGVPAADTEVSESDEGDTDAAGDAIETTPPASVD